MKVPGALIAFLAAWPITTAFPFHIPEKPKPIQRGGGSPTYSSQQTPSWVKTNGTNSPLSNTTTASTRSFVLKGFPPRPNLAFNV